MWSNLKGFRTVAFGLALALLPSALTYLVGVDWSQYVNPNVATLLIGALTLALRAVTTTPIGKK